MPARTPLEDRLERLDTRMTALEQLPARMDGVESALTVLSARIDDARRETRVLHEDVLGRIAVIGEGLTTLSERVDDQFIQLTGFIDASRTEVREMLAQILTRLDTPQRKDRG